MQNTNITVPFLDLHAVNSEIQSEVKNKLSELTDSCSFIGGEEVKRFSDQFGQYCQASCVTVANGTDALFLALKALGIKPGDEVLTVPFTFIATAEAVTMASGKIKFIDIHPKTYNMDPNLIERSITPKTKAILPVHLFGQPADMDPILEIAKKYKLKVIEDAAQAHGAEYKGRHVGSLGDVACFSFYPTKNLGGFGDGGAVTSNDLDLLKKVQQIADHGRIDRYFHAVEGVNSRLDAFQAAALNIKLRYLDRMNENRRHVAEQYQKALLQNNYITPAFIDSHAKHVFHLYNVESSFRDRLVAYLGEKKIGAGIYYPIPLHLQPAYAHLGYKRGDFPISERLSERICALPMYSGMTTEQVATVCRALQEFNPKL